MTLHYAIPDIHGRLDLLKKAFAAIFEHFGRSDETNIQIITLGDYIDRGPQSREVIEYLMKMQKEHPSLVCLAGNHELWMADIWRHGSMAADEWLHCGGYQTLFSYGHPRTFDLDMKRIPKAHIDWIARLPRYHESPHHVFVHAGVDPTVPMIEQREDTLTWHYYEGRDNLGYQGKHVVHGHHAMPQGPLLLPNRSNLDCQAWRTGRLTVAVFAAAGGPSEILQIKGAAA